MDTLNKANWKQHRLMITQEIHSRTSRRDVGFVIGIDIFVNCNWVATRWQLYNTHLHTNNTQNDTKQTIHRTTQKFLKSAGRAPSLRVIPWRLPYN